MHIEDILKNSNYKMAMIGLVLLLFVVGIGKAEGTPFDSSITFYTSDTKAFITDSSYAKIADIELKNAVTKSGGQLWLQDCDLFTCSLYVDFTPTEEYIINEKDFGGVAVGSDRVYYSMASLYEEHVVERTRATYTEKPKTVEVCDSLDGNKTYSCKNKIQTEMVQTGVETYEETVSGYEEAKDGTLLKAGEKYRFRFDFTRDKSNEVADLQPKLFNTVEGWAWWASTNSTINYWYDGASSVWAKVNTTAGTTGMYVYGNCSKASDSNGTNTFIFFEDGTNCGASKWTTFGSGATIATSTTYGTFCNLTAGSVKGARALYADGTNISLTNITIDYIFYVPALTSGGAFSRGTVGDETNNAYTVAPYSYTNNWDLDERTSGGSSNIFQNKGIYSAGVNYTVSYRSIGSIFELWVNGTNLSSGTDASKASGTIGVYQWSSSGKSAYFRNFRARLDVWNKPTMQYRTVETGSFSDGKGATCGYRVEVNITSATAMTDYVVELPYASIGSNTNLTLTDYWAPAEVAPALNYQALGPSTMYSNTSGVYCAVNWTHTINSTFLVRLGLAKNTVVLPAYTQTDSSYANGSLWNYTSFNLAGNFTHGDNVTCWTNASTANGDYNTTDEHTVEVVVGNYPPEISNVQITNPLQSIQNATGTADFYDLEGDTINCIFQWYRNGTSVYNSSQSPCTNTSTLTNGNYSATDLINFTVFANDSYDGVFTNLSSITVTVQPPFTWNNYTWTGTQYESISYAYTVNYTLPAGNSVTYTYLEYNGANVTPTCTNVSTTYYCSVSLYAPPEAVNGTAEVSYWHVNYTDGITPVESSTTFTPTVYFGMWATDINSVEEIAMESNAWINLSYSNVSGFGSSGATVSASAELGGNSAVLSCASGLCTGNIIAPTVTSPTIYRTSANYTITSSYWTTSVTRTVLLETVTGMETSTRQTTSGTITNPSNYNDTSWTTYATINYNAYFLFNYTLNKMANLTALRTKDTAGTRNDVPPEECWGSTVQFKAHRYPTTIASYSCYSYEDDAFVAVDAYTFVTNYYMYEENLTFTYNNSYTRVVPYGLSTTCGGGSTILFTYTCKDEDTKAVISCTYEQLFTLTLDTGAEADYSFNGTDTTWDICMVPSTLNGTVSSIGLYDGVGYETRDYFVFDAETSGKPYNQTIYLGTDADTQLTYIYVKRAGVKVTGAYVYVQKHYLGNDTFENVAMVKTDTSDGKGNTYLVPNDVWYRFIVVEGGVTTYTSETQHIACSPTASYCTVTLNIDTSSVDFWDYQNGISSACTFANATKIISCTYTNLDGTAKVFEFYVYNFTSGQVLLYNTNTSTASGTSFFDLGNENTTGLYSYFLRVGDYVLQSGTVNMRTATDWGEDSPILALLIILTLAFAFSVAGPTMMVVGAYLGFVVSWLFDFINLGDNSIAIVGGLGVVVGVLIYAFKK